MKSTDPVRDTVLNRGVPGVFNADGELSESMRLTPVSAIPEKQRFYDRLVEAGWRYHSKTGEWVDTNAPPDHPRVARMCWRPDFSEAWLQPPGRAVTTQELVDRVPTVPEPIMVMRAESEREVLIARLHKVAEVLEAAGESGTTVDERRDAQEAWAQVVLAIGILSREYERSADL